MKSQGNIYLHIIDTDTDKVVYKIRSSGVPRIKDEVRLPGQQGAIRIYKVLHIVWVYDEQGVPFDRVNVGVKLVFEDLSHPIKPEKDQFKEKS